MTLITINPSASNHDAWQGVGGAMTLTGEIRLSVGTSWGGLFLASVGVPAGASIDSAYLKYQATNSTRDDPDVIWYAEDADTTGVFTTGTSDISNRTRTSASVSDSATGIGNSTYRSVTITTLIAEVVARGGWASGHHIALIADAGSGSNLWIRPYDDGTGIWYVEINYSSGVEGAGAVTLGAVTTAAAGALPGHGAAASTLDAVTTAAASTLATHGAADSTLGATTATAAGVLPIKGTAGAAVGSFALDVAAGGDDGYENEDGAVDTGTIYLDLYNGAVGGVIFRNVAIPAGATVTNAYLNVRPHTTAADSPNLTIRGEYDPADFAETYYDLSGRTKTTANVVWSAANIGADAYKPSPDISAVIQEIIETGGWASGDNLALYLIDNDVGSFAFATLEYSFAYPPPQLVVEWSLVITGNALDDVTGSGAGTLGTHAAADATLEAVTGTATGGVVSGAAGDVTLGAVTGAAAAITTLSGAADSTLDAVTTTAAATLPIVGAGAATLDDATTSGAGVATLAGAADATLGAVTSSGAGVMPIVGAGDATLGDVTGAAVSELGLAVGAGAGNVTLGAVTADGAAMLLIVGASTPTLDDATTTGAGALLIAAAGAATLDAATTSGASRVSLAGQGAGTLGAVTVEAAGLLPIGAAGDVAIGDLATVATGALAITAAGAATLDAATGAAAGVVAVTGAGSATLGAATTTGAAVLVTHGAGTAALGAISAVSYTHLTLPTKRIV